MRYMPDLRLAIERDASKARDDASMIPRFESLRLNKGVSDVVEALLISAGAWRSIEAAQPPDVKSNYILGIDLGQNAAMSAAAAYNPLTKGLDCFAVFPANPSLAERGLRDGVGGAVHRHGKSWRAAGSRGSSIRCGTASRRMCPALGASGGGCLR